MHVNVIPSRNTHTAHAENLMINSTRKLTTRANSTRTHVLNALKHFKRIGNEGPPERQGERRNKIEISVTHSHYNSLNMECKGFVCAPPGRTR